jgi:transcription factor C subunit 7
MSCADIYTFCPLLPSPEPSPLAQPTTDVSGLHTRPHATSPKALVPHFPEITLHPTYTHTYYPSRRGESVEELNARIEGFLAPWVNRVQEDWPEVKTVVIFAHAATVIALGRAVSGRLRFTSTPAIR